LSRNLISYIGWMVTLTVGVVLVILIAVDLILEQENPYNSMVTYLVLPGVLMTGVGLVLLGITLEWRRRHRKHADLYPRLPHVDLNQPWQRRRIVFGVILASTLFTFSAVGVYRAYQFTESVVFCGQICHRVMKPEFTAYHHSPHARVACTECHIGSGAQWYVKAKLSGLRQVWAVLTESYNLPIPTPVHNLRPARDTCEECHWPAKFMDSVEKVIWHFSPDETNTPMRYNLLLKIGGGSAEMGLGQGIHWHVSPGVTVRYWARDEDRQDIPWVEVTGSDGESRIFRSADCPDPLPAEAEIRLMDCIDCHNRPSHVYRSPRQLIDFYMATGVLDRSLPYFKRYADALLNEHFPDTPTALETIRTELQDRYADWATGPVGQALVEQNIDRLQQLYKENYFPEQQVDWRTHPNNGGHFEWPGCYRCHDDQHADASGRVVSNDCRNCHEILDQAEGESAFDPMHYQGGEFIHPRNLGDIWKGYYIGDTWIEYNCTDCHGLAGQAEGIPTPPPSIPPS
jgi:hypothetical protein